MHWNTDEDVEDRKFYIKMMVLSKNIFVLFGKVVQFDQKEPSSQKGNTNISFTVSLNRNEI